MEDKTSPRQKTSAADRDGDTPDLETRRSAGSGRRNPSQIARARRVQIMQILIIQPRRREGIFISSMDQCAVELN